MGKLISAAVLSLLALVVVACVFFTGVGRAVLSLLLSSLLVIVSLCVMPFVSLKIVAKRK